MGTPVLSGPAEATPFPPRGSCWGARVGEAAPVRCRGAALHPRTRGGPGRLAEEAPPAGRSLGGGRAAGPPGPARSPWAPAHLVVKSLGQGALQGAAPQCGPPAGSPAPEPAPAPLQTGPGLRNLLSISKGRTGAAPARPLRGSHFLPREGALGEPGLAPQPSAKTLQSHGGPPRPRRPAGPASPRFNDR